MSQTPQSYVTSTIPLLLLTDTVTRGKQTLITNRHSLSQSEMIFTVNVANRDNPIPTDSDTPNSVNWKHRRQYLAGVTSADAILLRHAANDVIPLHRRLIIYDRNAISLARDRLLSVYRNGLVSITGIDWKGVIWSCHEISVNRYRSMNSVNCSFTRLV